MDTHKVYWPEIKERVKATNPEFYSLIDVLQPGSDFPLYLVNYDYGELIGDKLSQFIPIKGKGLLRLNDSTIPSEINAHLGYGKHSSPMGMILNKHFEWYVDLPHKNMILPILVQMPGDFFSYTRVMDMHSQFNYSPMGVLSAMSGARTAFMLPSIGCQNKITKLCRELKIKTKQPHYLYDHFKLFKSVLQSPEVNNTWESSLIYFSENWINHMKTDPDWFEVQKYFYTVFARKSLYLKNLPHYQTAYSLLLESTNQKPNPYLFDTFKHLIDIMSGETPGFSPQITNDLLPLDILQTVFIEFYGLKTTAPTIMGPQYFNIEDVYSLPTYYSLQFPTTRTFSPNSKKSSTMAAMRELKDMCVDLFHELKKSNGYCHDTIIQHVAQRSRVDFFHNTNDIDGSIENVSYLINADDRFNYTRQGDSKFNIAEDSKFFRGCIKIHRKDDDAT